VVERDRNIWPQKLS